jgi:hypothetical protein
MKINIRFKQKLGAPLWHLDLNIIGAGKIDDPFIISPPKCDYYEEGYDRGTFYLNILESNSFTEIRKYDLRAITLVNCSNFTISNSVIRMVKLKNCSNILIKNDSIWKKLILESCHYVDLVDSKIHIFDAITSDDLLASKCQFDRVKKRTYSCSLTIENSKIMGFKNYLPSYSLSNF